MGVVTERHVIRLLGAGLMTMVALVAVDGLIGFQAILSVRRDVAHLTESQFRQVALLDEVQRAQAGYSSVVYELSADPRSASREKLRAYAAQTGATLNLLLASVHESDPDISVWRELAAASDRVGRQVEALIDNVRGRPDLSNLVKEREHLLELIAKLIRSNHERSATVVQQIMETTRKQILKDAALLSSVVAISIFCAWLVIRTARKLYRLMTAQSEELQKVSWQLLEKQETLARRLSHELHDDLGQKLTALKTNFSRHSVSCSDPNWMRDCTDLLRDSIRSAHEISQLLRPTILDDFGLDSALAWLCERFEERNQIEVRFDSLLRERLDEATETHIFRIAQEALTNISRHASASQVWVSLTERDGTVRLVITDNGKGFPVSGPDDGRSRHGLTGMRARTRSLEGEMQITSTAGEGTRIAITFPRKEVPHATEDSRLVG